MLKSSKCLHVINAPTQTIALVEEFAMGSGQSFSSGQHSLADVDGDGSDEVLIASASLLPDYSAFCYVYDPLPPGLPWGGWALPPIVFPPQPQHYWILSRVWASDVDFDGVAEVGTSDGGITQGSIPFHLVHADSTPLNGFPLTPSYGTASMGYVAFADLDRSGSGEILGSEWQVLFGHRSDGSWQFYPPPLMQGSFYKAIAIGNFDADPNLEIAVGTGSSQLRVFDPDTEAVVWTYTGPFAEFVCPTAGDLNGDGVDELVVHSQFENGVMQAHVHAFDMVSQTEVAGFPYMLPMAQLPGFFPPVDLYDLDRDGSLELISLCASQAGTLLVVLDVPNPGLPVYEASWPTLDGNSARNGDYHWRRGPYPHATRGDANLDGRIDLGDAGRQLLVLFGGQTTPCPLALDIDADASVDLADVILLLGYLYLAGPPPEPPFPECSQLPRSPLCSVEVQCP